MDITHFLRNDVSASAPVAIYCYILDTRTAEKFVVYPGQTIHLRNGNKPGDWLYVRDDDVLKFECGTDMRPQGEKP